MDSHTPTRWLPALVLLAGSACPVALAAPAGADDDPTCVGSGEYKNITAGMTIAKLQQAVHDQVPFAETVGKGKKRYRWYVACEAWKPDLDVVVRFHQPVVGRRTVTKKALAVYAAPPA